MTRDITGTQRDDYFFTTGVAMTPKTLVETFTARGSIETTFQELRAYLGLETTRGWSEKTVLPAAPCLFGLFSVVALLYARLAAKQRRAGFLAWPGKTDPAFSDAITAVRRWQWLNWVFATPRHHDTFAKLSGPTRAVLLRALLGLTAGTLVFTRRRPGPARTFTWIPSGRGVSAIGQCESSISAPATSPAVR